ncbi:RNA demethylase ALKBH9B [Hirschfeldia incana]|nr:RNA demethylase ALKBH9B [Hirschfeldia incana]
MEDDPFLRKFQPSELKIASEFLTNCLPFLSRDLCKDCVNVLSDRIRSLDPEHCSEVDGEGNSKAGLASEGTSNNVKETQISFGTLSEVLGSVLPSRQAAETASTRMSWADMSQEDEFEEEDEEDETRKAIDASPMKTPEKPKLSREQREDLRLRNVKRKKDFICLERVKGKLVNVVDGLELHTGVFSAVEQKRIVDKVYELEERGRKGELRERTCTAPQKWMRGKGRVTIQFGCCYNYATDRAGNPPGILQREEVDPLPSLFKVIIRRLIAWHVLPPSCVPDSCIVNIYDEGDCIPPHIDNHDFLRPFCTISFLSECDILFGSNLRIEGPGEFSGSFSVPLPVGSGVKRKWS